MSMIMMLSLVPLFLCWCSCQWSKVLLFFVCICFAMPDVDVKANKKAGGFGDGTRLALELFTYTGIEQMFGYCTHPIQVLCYLSCFSSPLQMNIQTIFFSYCHRSWVTNKTLVMCNHFTYFSLCFFSLFSVFSWDSTFLKPMQTF